MDRRKNDAARGQTTPGPRLNEQTPVLPHRPTKRPRPEPPKGMKNSEIPNFSIICRDGVFKVRESDLSTTPGYFKKMIGFGGTETNTKQVVLADMESSIMKCILTFIHTSKYALSGGTIIPSSAFCNHNRASYKYGPSNAASVLRQKCRFAGTATSRTHLLPHIEIYSWADYFQLDSLKEYARQKVFEVLHVHWHDDDLELKDALEAVFTTTPEEDSGLRDMFIGLLKAHPTLKADAGDVKSWVDSHPHVRSKIEAE